MKDDSDFEKPEPRNPSPESCPRYAPVLFPEVLEFLDVRSDGFYVDATLGAGGHAEIILRELQWGRGRLLGIERDPSDLALAREPL